MDANGNYLKKGNTYGLRGSAEGGATAYGVYGYADEATTNWAGYFVGNVKATGTVTDSDIRLKKDIETLCGSLEKVLRLRGVSYYWKNREEMAAAKGVTADSMDYGFDNRKHIGVIAQEIEKEFPELVITDADGFKSVQYSNLTPILIEAMKEQQQIIDNQQKQLEAFKTDKANLQQQIDELRSLIEQLMNK